MNKETLIKVKNRDNGSVAYSIPELNGLRRVFQIGETKEITFEELEKLSYIPGGMELLKDSLVILNNKEAINTLLGEVEPEYNYSEKEIVNLMQNGSLDQFLDCLDFAPQGVQNLIKTLSVSLPLNDVNKRQAIYKKLGFNVDNAIRIQKETLEDEEPKHQVSKRRVSHTATTISVKQGPTATTRRVVKK